MSGSYDPMRTVRQYIDGFNGGDTKAVAAACDGPMQILDGMCPHVCQGPTAAEALAEGEYLGVWVYNIVRGEPRHGDVPGDYAYAVAPVAFSYKVKGKQVT